MLQIKWVDNELQHFNKLLHSLKSQGLTVLEVLPHFNFWKIEIWMEKILKVCVCVKCKVDSLQSWKVTWYLGRILGIVCIEMPFQPLSIDWLTWKHTAEDSKLSPHHICKQTFEKFSQKTCEPFSISLMPKGESHRSAGALPTYAFLFSRVKDMGQNLLLENAINKFLWNKFWPGQRQKKTTKRYLKLRNAWETLKRVITPFTFMVIPCLS